MRRGGWRLPAFGWAFWPAAWYLGRMEARILTVALVEYEAEPLAVAVKLGRRSVEQDRTVPNPVVFAHDQLGLAFLGERLSKFWIKRPAVWRLTPAASMRGRRLDFAGYKERFQVVRVDSVTGSKALADIDRAKRAPSNPAEYFFRRNTEPFRNLRRS
jgi:hypothetical protein